MGRVDAAQNILPLVADDDPVISHLAVRALSELKASAVCLGALDSADEKVKPGALRALYGMDEADVVDGLIRRIDGERGELRRGILNALCRLANVDAPYLSPKEWWGTRPDTSGPVYKPVRWEQSEKIEAALKTALDAATGEEGRWLVQRMYMTRVNFPGLVELMLAKAGADTSAKLAAIEAMFRPDNALPKEGAEALRSIAINEKENPEPRAKALRLLARGATHATVFPLAAESFASLAGRDLPHPAW
jgi:hypothetical protein